MKQWTCEKGANVAAHRLYTRHGQIELNIQLRSSRQHHAQIEILRQHEIERASYNKYINRQ